MDYILYSVDRLILIDIESGIAWLKSKYQTNKVKPQKRINQKGSMSTQFHYNPLHPDALNTLIEDGDAYDIFIDCFGRGKFYDTQTWLNTFPTVASDIWKFCQEENNETNVPYGLHQFLSGELITGGYCPHTAPVFLVKEIHGVTAVNAIFGGRIHEDDDHLRYWLPDEVQEVHRALLQILESNLYKREAQIGTDYGEGCYGDIRELAQCYAKAAKHGYAMLITISD